VINPSSSALRWCLLRKCVLHIPQQVRVVTIPDPLVAIQIQQEQLTEGVDERDKHSSVDVETAYSEVPCAVIVR